MIETQDLSKKFEDFLAVDGVDLKIGAGEVLALQLATMHNLSYYLALTTGARQAILEGRFAAWKEEQLRLLGGGGGGDDPDNGNDNDTTGRTA